MKSQEYLEWIKKFDRFHSSDDTFTPAGIYDTVEEWVRERFPAYADSVFMRPFYPTGDYQKEEYPDNCAVVDNPSFGILSQICNYYDATGIPYFLFCFAKTALNLLKKGRGLVHTASPIMFDNGATLRVSFITNMFEGIMFDGDFSQALCNVTKKKRPSRPFISSMKLARYNQNHCIIPPDGYYPLKNGFGGSILIAPTIYATLESGRQYLIEQEQKHYNKKQEQDQDQDYNQEQWYKLRQYTNTTPELIPLEKVIVKKVIKAPIVKNLTLF